MQPRTSSVIAPLLVCVFASVAMAQTAPASPATDQVPGRGYVSALAGATFSPGASSVFSVEYGDQMRRDVHAYVTFSYFENLMSQAMRDDLTALSGTLSSYSGTPWEFTGRDRGAAFVAGAKYVAPGTTVRPYVGGGLGAISLKRTIVDRYRGDLTTAVFNDFNIGEPGLASTSATKPLVEAGAGVEIAVRHTYVDVGYRYRHAFRLTDAVNVSQLSVGIGYRF